MELTVTGGMPATPATTVPSAPSRDQMPSDPPVAVVQPAVAESEWPPQQWPPQQWPPQQWPTQQWPQQPPPQQQPWPPQQQAWPPAGVTSQTWAAAPAVSAAPAVTVTKRRSGRARAVDLIFGLSMLVAVGGVAFAIGRATAPTSTATNAPFAGLGGFPDRTGQNAVVPPAASSAPDASVQQGAAPSGAPVIPSPGTGTGPGAFQGAAPGGFGRGGLTGTVSALGDGSITFTTADGQTTEVTTSDATTYHQQAAATVADVTVGSSVRITPAGGLGGGAGLSASDVEILLPTQGDGSSTTGQGTGGADPGRGFGRGGLMGTVSAITDGTISITTATGQTMDVATTDTTTYHRQATATADAVTIGSSIRITAAGAFGAGPAASAAPGAAAGVPAVTASDVEVLLPTGG